MSRSTPDMRLIAKCLIAYEARENKSSESETAAFLIVEKLRPHLTTLMGSAGFRALFSRAVSLASADIPELEAITVNADGSLKGVEKVEAQLSPQEISESRVMLLAHLLGLLVAFIGASLTIALVREVWPKLSPDVLNFSKGGKN